MRISILVVWLLIALSGIAYENPNNDANISNIQMLATHNSYKMYPDPRIYRDFARFCPLSDIRGIYYQHLPLEEQLSNYGVRHVEIDILADPNGGHYSKFKGLSLIGYDGQSNDPLLDEPGFKVMHDPNWDFNVRCRTFKLCLKQLNDWSDAHPNHLPLFVHVETKNDSFALPNGTLASVYEKLRLTKPIPFNAELVDNIDVEIRSVVPTDKIITPDLVRANFATLREAVLANAWPTIAQARGKLIFILNVEPIIQGYYLHNHPSLRGRTAFVYAEKDADEAAFVLLNSPVESEAEITSVVGQGFMVRTRADSEGDEAIRNDLSRATIAWRSGAHFVSTDYLVPEPAFHNNYVVSIPGGNPARCNPIRPATCSSVVIAE
jgi:hypothetical protein